MKPESAICTFVSRIRTLHWLGFGNLCVLVGNYEKIKRKTVSSRSFLRVEVPHFKSEN
jgi:hypothetical protein